MHELLSVAVTLPVRFRFEWDDDLRRFDHVCQVIRPCWFRQSHQRSSNAEMQGLRFYLHAEHWRCSESE